MGTGTLRQALDWVEYCNGAGERVTFTVDPGRLHFFDPDTGQAVQ